MQRCAHCGHHGRRNAHCSSPKKKLRHKTPRPRQRADKNDKKRGILPTECFIPVGTPHYSHKPFDDKRCIRLLVLLPGNKWDPVRCELVVRSLDNAQYEAISYAWGPQADRGDILCHDQRLRVPWNLEHGLRKFRRLRRKRVLWADSVCINQDDTAERGHQVQNMSRIYENAKRVLVWLGRSPRSYSNPSALFEFIRTLGSLPPPDHQSADYVDYRIKVHGWKHWPTFRDLGHTGWFNRLWVIQEIHLASNAIIHLGPASIDWKVLVSFCIRIAIHHHDLLRTYGLGLVSTVVLLSILRFQDPNADILYVLEKGYFKECSDDRDRVYAFLGHRALRDTIANPRSDLFLPVNYSITSKDLYTSLAIRLIKSNGFSSLHVLDYVTHDRVSISNLDIHSWVPTWTHVGIPFVYTEDGRYNAHGQTHVDASLNGNCLSVVGFVFDSVVWVSDIFDTSQMNFPHEPFVQIWNHVRQKWGANSRSALEVICILLSNESMRPEETQRFINAVVAHACLLELDVSGMEDLATFEDIPYFMNRLVCAGRCYFVTSRGWIGIVPGAALPGDDVCIFFGASTPFVVRQLPSAGEALYRLSGPCKVSGIMKGEATKMWEGGAFDKTTFNLI